jgi:hypothetical protein
MSSESNMTADEMLDWLEADGFHKVLCVGKTWYSRESVGHPHKKCKSLRDAIIAVAEICDRQGPQIYKVKSLSSWKNPDGEVFITIQSPVSSKRSLSGFREKVGQFIEIDGFWVKILKLETFSIGSDIKIGEKISLSVELVAL